MLWGLYTLGFDWEANDFFYFIADVAEADEGDLQVMYGDRRRARARPSEMLDHLTGYDGARPVRDRQRRVRPAPARRLGRACSTRSTCTRKSRDRLAERIWPMLRARWRRARRTGASRTAASGRCAASRSTSPPRRSCAGWPPTAARAWRACARTSSSAERWQAAADEIHADICANALDERGVLHPALRHRGARRVAAADAAGRLPAARRPARPRHGAARSPTS